MVTVSGIVVTAVSVAPELVAVAAVVKVKLVAARTEVATVSPVGIPGPEMTAPAESDTAVAVVTVVLPAAVEAAKLCVVVVVLGIPVPLMVIAFVNALVDAVVAVVLPLVRLALMVDDAPLRLTHWLFEVWQATQKVGLVALFCVLPRLTVTLLPLSMIALDELHPGY
jgi:hypothetical protein